MTIHSFGDYLDFHPHLHALVADGLFMRSGLFYVMPEVSLKPLDELFRARVITFLTGKGLLPPERARMLRGWVHSGFNIHRSRRVLSDERDDLERLAQYIIRGQNAGQWERRLDRLPFRDESKDPAQVAVRFAHCRRFASAVLPAVGSRSSPPASGHFAFAPLLPGGSRSRFARLIAAITQHIPDKSFQLIRYYGWYSNKMRGQRDKRVAEEAGAAGNAVEIIDVSEHKPRRIP